MAAKNNSGISNEFHFQTCNRDLTEADFVRIAKDDLKARGISESDISKLEFYVKPEDAKVYFVANNDTLGEFDL